MPTLPKFTKRAAIEIARLERKFAADLPPGKYMNCVGWEIGHDDNFTPRPELGLHEIALVPGEYQVECHGLRLAYSIPLHVLATLGDSVLDFDGHQFVFVPGNLAP
jgi:hypothetical protein